MDITAAGRSRVQAATPLARRRERERRAIAVHSALPKRGRSCCNRNTTTGGRDKIAYWRDKTKQCRQVLRSLTVPCSVRDKRARARSGPRPSCSTALLVNWVSGSPLCCAASISALILAHPRMSFGEHLQRVGKSGRSSPPNSARPRWIVHFCVPPPL